jgi:carboxyl-terminal processing protease
MPLYRPEGEHPRDRKMIIWLPLMLGVALGIGMLAGVGVSGGGMLFNVSEVSSENGSQIHAWDEVIRFIEHKYVDSIDLEEVQTRAINKLLEELDPHSGYIPPSEVKRFNEQMEGRFEGIGVEYYIVDDSVRVIGLIGEDGPAQAAGIKVGDVLLAVDGILIEGSKVHRDSLSTRLKGSSGTGVTVRWLAVRTGEIEESRLIRKEIRINSVEAGFAITPETGYIRIGKFTGTSYREFMQQLEALKKENSDLSNLILDLRGNPGGYLSEAVKIVSQLFREKGQLLVFTEGKHSRKQEYKSTGKLFFPIEKVAVLMDERSASGSEVIAGAIQDWDRGVIIGRHSFGKGLVQEQYELKNGGALRLTVARYYTPSGRSIQRDYSDLSAYLENAKGESALAGEILIDSLDVEEEFYYTNKKKRKVMGGGGIQPDVYVEADDVQEIYQTPTGRQLVLERAYDLFRSILHDIPGEHLFEAYANANNDKLPGSHNANGTTDGGENAALDPFSERAEARAIWGEVARMAFGENGKRKYLSAYDEDVITALRAMTLVDPLSLAD